MATPAQSVIDRVFRDFRKDGRDGEPVDDVWELFVAELLLRPNSLDDEEIRSGVVDGSGDGGIDSFYTFLNGVLVQSDNPALESEETATKSIGDSPTIEVLLIQSKNRESWQETVLEKLLSSIPMLMNHSHTEEYLLERYREDLVRQVLIFRTLVENLAMKFPRYTFRVVYASRAPETAITQIIRDKATQVETTVRDQLTPGASVTCELLGADGIYELAGRSHSATAKLKLRDTMIRGEGSYLGIASLSDYLSFVRDGNGRLRAEMFESNVRDFEGANTVNRSIQETLASSSGAEFWWQNNGVTVLGRRVDAPNQTLTIEQPLIVNGLQTTHVLDQTDRDSQLHDSRREEGILVRIIESEDDEIRDQVIAGTNRQTKVDGSALYATDELQIDIERYFLAHDWYYERRKNRYKNLKKPAARRVSIGLLAQAIMSLHQGEPDAARGRPTTALNKGYESVFNKEIGTEGYLRAAQMLSSVSAFLRTTNAKEIVNDFSNVRFYLLVGASMAKLNAKGFDSLHFHHNYSRLPETFEEGALIQALQRVETLFREFSGTHPKMTRDSIAKSAVFRQWFLTEFNA